MFYEKPLPFYLAYPLLKGAFEEELKERDRLLLRSYYSDTARELQEMVEAECDRMDYDGSMIYDEYPDKLMLRQVCARIHNKYAKDHGFEMEAEDRRQGEDLRDLIGVLLYNEMYRRRCRKKRCRRYF